MNSPSNIAAIGSASASGDRAALRASSRVHRVLIFPIKLLWGMLFCQSLAGSILVAGWTYRLAQRAAFKFWFSRSARATGELGFARYAASEPIVQPQVHWPNWFAQQNFRQATCFQAELGVTAYVFKLLRTMVHSLSLNFWMGLRGIANTTVLIAPACVLWWFGWYDGWNNSFNKGYEQAAVGPLISLLGIAWFIAAMFYVPLAQARQAVTEQWRSFYQFRLIWKLVRDRWVYCVLLALLYSVLSIPLSVLKTSPMFWMHNSPALSNLSATQVVASLKGYFFWCALVMFPAFVIVHVAAGRIYASGLISLVRLGRIQESELAPNERELLNRLGLLEVGAEPERHRLIRFITWTGSRLGRAVGAFVLVLIWFSFVAQIYISEFVNYHGSMSWLNQPLIQLPWFRYLPASVRNPLADISSALLVVLIALLFRSFARSFRSKVAASGC